MCPVFLVVDYGHDKYTSMIAECLDTLEVMATIVQPDHILAAVYETRPVGVILSGGPGSVYADDSLLLDPQFYEAGLPTLGICLGMQLLAHQLGGTVERRMTPEKGMTQLCLNGAQSVLFPYVCLPDQRVWMNHHDSVSVAPRGAVIVASTAGSAIAVFEMRERHIFGVQFHPEAVATPYANAVFTNFVTTALHHASGPPRAPHPAHQPSALAP
jgi:GMP synthase (glutamine-hydrolysing)